VARDLLLMNGGALDLLASDLAKLEVPGGFVSCLPIGRVAVKGLAANRRAHPGYAIAASGRVSTRGVSSNERFEATKEQAMSYMGYRNKAEYVRAVNRELEELNSHSNRVRSLHGQRVRAGQFAFVGYQYSLPFMGGTFEKPEAGIERDLRDLAELVGAETVVVTHTLIWPHCGGFRRAHR